MKPRPLTSARVNIIMAEVHVIGELVGGSDFPSGDLFCKWGVSHGSGWRVLEGLKDGQTQIDHPQVCGFAVSHNSTLSLPMRRMSLSLTRAAGWKVCQVVASYW